MPNWLYLFTNLFYHLGLAVWVGGGLVLGAIVAPGLFRELPRPQAGGIFGQSLRRFGSLRAAALVLVVASTAMKYVLWESGPTIWIAIRWLALVVMAATLVYEIGFLSRELESRRLRLTPDMPDSDPERRAFQTLHKRAEALMKIGMVAALAAMLWS
jgi:uncharacterized membrane protein